ncbi:MAG: hypothetical protein K9M51_02195 [Candidatus Gracilibacteria bacterium]|nr:hypothetical protein [Candidatus Gracilibacteria bacterium]
MGNPEARDVFGSFENSETNFDQNSLETENSFEKQRKNIQTIRQYEQRVIQSEPEFDPEKAIAEMETPPDEKIKKLWEYPQIVELTKLGFSKKQIDNFIRVKLEKTNSGERKSKELKNEVLERFKIEAYQNFDQKNKKSGMSVSSRLNQLIEQFGSRVPPERLANWKKFQALLSPDLIPDSRERGVVERFVGDALGSGENFDTVVDRIFSSTQISEETKKQISKKFEKLYAKNPDLTEKLLKEEAAEIRAQRVEKTSKENVERSEESVERSEESVERSEESVERSEESAQLFERRSGEKNIDFFVRLQSLDPEKRNEYFKFREGMNEADFKNFQTLLSVTAKLPEQDDRTAVEKIVNAANLNSAGSFDRTLSQIWESPDVSTDAKTEILQSFPAFKPPKIVTASDAISAAKKKDRLAQKAEKQKRKIDATLQDIDDQILALEAEWATASPKDREEITKQFAALKKQKQTLETQSAEIEEKTEPNFKKISVRGTEVSREGSHLQISLEDWQVLAPTRYLFDPQTTRRTFNCLLLARELKKHKLDMVFLGEFHSNKVLEPYQLSRSAKILDWLNVKDTGEILSNTRIRQLNGELEFLYKNPSNHEEGSYKKDQLKLEGVITNTGEPNGKNWEEFWRTKKLPSEKD